MNFPKNPLTLRGHLPHCWLFSYRTPVEAVRPLLPLSLEPVSCGGFAFWNIVVCEVADLRPAPLPAFLGLAYWQVAYRLLVRAQTAGGRTIEGLHFLRSDCDRQIVTLAGNWLTDFNFHSARIAVTASNQWVDGHVQAPGGEAHFRLDRTVTPSLAAGSPFGDLAEAKRFLKYKPLAISARPEGGFQVVRVSRVESAWKSRAIVAKDVHWEFLAGQPAELELCTEVAPIDYQWNRGENLEQP